LKVQNELIWLRMSSDLKYLMLYAGNFLIYWAC